MTEKFFEFNLQRFDLPETPTISAADNKLVVDGSDTMPGTATTQTADSDTVNQIVAANYSPTNGDSKSLDDITYTYDGSNWSFNSDTTAAADSDTTAAITAQFYSPANGDTRTLDDITYTFTDGNWTYESDTYTPATADSDTTANIIAQFYSPQEDDEHDGYTFTDGIWLASTPADEDAIAQIFADYYTPTEGDEHDGYTFDGDNWTSTTTADDDTVAAIIDEYYTPHNDDTQTLDDITYTFDGENWTYTDTNGEDATADSDTTAAIIAQFYTPQDGDEHNDYTFNGENWTSTTTADDDTAAQILADYYTPQDGDVRNGYTYTNEEWLTTTPADSDTAAAILSQYYTPADGDEQELDDVTYTFDGDNWNYEAVTTETLTATDDIASQLNALYAPADGDSQSLNDITYTYDGTNWNFDTTTTITATDDIASQLNALYAPNAGATQSYEGTTYTYTDSDTWTFKYTPTVTSYYRFSASVSPASIGTDTTTGALANTSLAAPATIVGNGSDFVLDGVGTIKGLDSSESVTITATAGTAAITGLDGDITLAAIGKNVDQTINGAALSYTTDDAVYLESAPDSDTPLTATASAAVTLKSIDANQQWLLNSDSDTALTYGKVAYTAQGEVYATANGSILSATLDEGESVIMTKDGSGRADIVEINGVTINSAAKAGGTSFTKVSADDDFLVLTAGTNGSSLSVNDSNVNLADDASATVVGTGSDAAITAVDKLDPSGKWVTDEHSVSIGNQVWDNPSHSLVTLTADDAGTAISKVNSAGTIALNAADTKSAAAANVNINGKATWILSGSDDDFDDFAVFDANGNVTLTSDDRFGATAALNSGKNVTLTAATTADVLTLSKNDSVTITEDDVVTANSIAAGGTWAVGADTAILGSQTLTGASGAVITSHKSRGDIISSVSSLSGDATLTFNADSVPSGLTIADSTWTINHSASDSDSNSVLVFNDAGAVTVTAPDTSSTLVVSSRSVADSGAAVINISNSDATALLNGVNVSYSGDDADGVDFVLEDKSNNAGIAAITGLDGAHINIDGDNSFMLNEKSYYNAFRNDADLYVSGDFITLHDVKNNDVVSISGGAGFDFAEAKDKSVAVTLNGAGVSVDAAAADDIGNLYVSADDKGISGIFGVKTTATINATDDSFSVYYGRPTEAQATLNINDAQIIIDSDSYSTDSDVGISVHMDGDDFTINGLSVGANDTLTVTGGSYKIGKSAAVSVTETLGYITFDKHGNATAVEKSVVDNENAREGAIDSAESVVAAAAPPVLVMYQQLTTDDSDAPHSSVAGYDDVNDSDASTSSVEGGINVYGNAALDSDDLTAVTLQSFTDDDIVIFEAEDSTIRESVIDVSGGKASVVAIDPKDGTTGVNHTVLGSNTTPGYIRFGANARGNNYAAAGSVASYLANEGGTATLVGGAGADSIAAKKGDKVTGGAGADYFFDANGAYEISDYNVSEGDVIVATKLADINKNLDAQTLVDKITVKGNTINIAGGGKFTLGGNASSDVTVTNVRFTDSNAQDIHKLTWAAADGGNVNTNAFTDGSVLVVADQNGGASDSVVGSSGNDTIFVGGNDTVNAGAGKDEIYITSANTAKKEEGAVVALSAGRTYVHGWSFGFDNSAGANILNADAGKLTFDNKEDTLLAYNSNDTIYFVDNDSATEVFDLLIGTPDDNYTASLIRSSANVQITTDDDVADYYYTAADVNATLTFTDGVGDIGDTISLNGGNYFNIHSLVLNNNGAATLVGTDDKDVVVLSGAAESDAHKHVSLGGGNDSVISGGTSTSVAGNVFYFGLGADGADVINDFGYYQGGAADPDRAAADKVILYNWVEGISGITANGRNIEIKVNDNSKLTLQESAGINANNKVIYQIGYDGEERIAQVGTTSGAKNNFAYDKETFAYLGNAEGGADTLSIAEEDDNVEVWLDGRNGGVYQGVGVIDATASTGTQLTLSGGDVNASTTIRGGGEGTSSSLWGGVYGDNELFGGAGNDVFFFTKDDVGSATISDMDADHDRLILFGLTLDDLVESKVGDGKVSLTFQNGGSVTINDASEGLKASVLVDGRYQEYTTTADDWKKTE